MINNNNCSRFVTSRISTDFLLKMAKLARNTLKTAISLVKQGCAEELAELLNDEFTKGVTKNTKTNIPCNLVRKFRDNRPRIANDAIDDDEDNETAFRNKYDTKSNLCCCVSYAKKEELSRSLSKESSKLEMFTHHKGTLLELGAAYGQPGVVEILLKLGANPYGIYDGTTALLQALMHWSHTYMLQDRSACFRYRKVVALLLENIDSKKYSLLWDRCPNIDKQHRVRFHPINFTCSLNFSTGLETLLRTGFRIPGGTDSALSQVLCQPSTSDLHILTYRTIECIDLLGQYGYTFRVGLKADIQLSRYLNKAFYHTIVRHPHPKGLSQLMELGANPTAGPGQTPYLLTALESHYCANRQQYIRTRFGFFNARGRSGLIRSAQRIPDCTCKVKDVANILIVANCDLKFRNNCSQYQASALSLAILRYPSLIFPLLKAGVKVDDTRDEPLHRFLYDGFSSKNDLELAEERLSGKFLSQFLSFVNNEDGIKMSLKFQCRIFIRNYLGICTYKKLLQTGLPMQLVSYLMLNG